MLAPSVKTPIEQTDLLPRRMAALGLDADTVARFDPITFRDLQRVCGLCEYHEQCQWDLSQNHANSTWLNYCPNWARSVRSGYFPGQLGLFATDHAADLIPRGERAAGPWAGPGHS
jgi:hypothetical protein